MISRTQVLFVAIISFLFSIYMATESYRVLSDFSSPIVSGRITARSPTSRHGIPSADFTIRIDSTTTDVHAITGRYLLNALPDSVQFHYSGDPSRLVFLFEHEEQPLWISLFCLAGSLFFFWILSGWRGTHRIRKALRWEH